VLYFWSTANYFKGYNSKDTFMPLQILDNHDQFTGFEYVLIDIANHYGKDKDEFPQRLEWAYENFHHLEALADDRGHWKEKPLYQKGVMALRQIQAGEPIGHMIGLDAVCSGMQVLSAITGCEAGARSTGMIDPDRRADAYTDCTKAMQRRIPSIQEGARADIKQAVMTCFFGSKAIPEALFGEGTRELQAFYHALMEIGPGACRALKILKGAWQPKALAHTWLLPDRHTANIPVIETIETRVEVDELDHTTFSYRYDVNNPAKKGISLIANVTHSLDAWVARTLIRRCNYNPEAVNRFLLVAQSELLERNMDQREMVDIQAMSDNVSDEVFAGISRYLATGIADITLMDHLDQEQIQFVCKNHLHALIDQANQMLVHAPFPILCIHDEFKFSPNNMNYLRHHYREIMAQLADSDVFVDIVTQITGKRPLFTKLSNTLGDKIRQSNYSIC